MISFDLTEEQQLLVNTARRIADKEIAPLAAAIDQQGEIPWAVVDLYKKYGFYSLIAPEEYGGAGVDTLTFLLVVEQVARVCSSSTILLGSPYMGAKLLLASGDKEKCRQWIPKMVSGEAPVVAFALTEPGAGSDSRAITTRATPEGDVFVLNGVKNFITNADVASFLVLFAKTGDQVTAFLVPQGTPGLSIGKIEHKMGTRGSHTCEVILDGCRVPRDAILGVEGRGLELAYAVIRYMRPLTAIRSVGLAQGALDYALNYSRQRVQFGRPIADFQAIRFKLADMAMRIEAARLLAYRAAVAADGESEQEAVKLASMAKCFASDTAMDTAVEAVQILGGYGYCTDFPLERFLRDAKATQIVEGTNEIQRIVIARELLRS